MNYNDLELLTRIYNTLLLVNTRGEDTITMGECLKTLKGFVLAKKEELENQNKQDTEKED